MTRAPRNTALIILTVVGALVFTVSVAIYAWLFTTIQSTAEQVGLVSKEVELLTTKNAHTQEVRRLVRVMSGVRAELDSYFLHETDIVSFLERLESIGAERGAPVRVQSVSVGDAIDKDGLLVELEMVLKSEGAFTDVLHTLSLLDTYPRVISVESVRMTQDIEDLTWFGEFRITAVQQKTPEHTPEL